MNDESNWATSSRRAGSALCAIFSNGTDRNDTPIGNVGASCPRTARVKDSPMFIRAIAFLLFLASVVRSTAPIVPDPKLTPGDAFGVTVQDLCVPGYTKKVRNVPAEFYSLFDTLGSTTFPLGRTTTKNICRIGPLTVSEKHTRQNGTGVVRNS